jgi:uncharacterized membrane protein YozB (DUF420 family)
MNHLVSGLAYVLIIIGMFSIKHRKRHRALMLAAFTIDMSLVLFLELTRDATGQALEFPNGMLGFHISMSILTVILYFVLIPMGFKMYKGNLEIKKIFRPLAYIFLLSRTLNFITSFYLN